MSGFSPAQLRKLVGKLDRARVRSRTVDGKQIDYLEGWFALSEANAIFGFANWDRQTVHFERLFERTRGEMTICAYASRVRVVVRAGDTIISREGTGCGTASARNAADAHERAIKAAETDATKRALATFGNRFGLCLYDKEQAGVSEPALRSLGIFCPDGQVFAEKLSPESFCTALRKIVETTSDSTELAAWHQRNAPAIDHLRSLAPGLRTQRGYVAR
jgi:DNA recombination protein Rad52